MSSDSLVDFITSVSGEDFLTVEENLGDGFVRLRTAEAQRRQAKHDIRCVEDICIEMLRNARDAHAKRIFVAISREGSEKTLVFLDDGDGIPDHMHELVFEPRVTSKLETMVMDKWGVHGRGMALYSIRENAKDTFVVASEPEMGSAFSVTVDLDELSEKKDQSTYPTVSIDESGVVTVGRGPHNVVRCIVEFALEHEGEVEVYLGTPTTVSAALYAQGKASVGAEELLFLESAANLAVCDRPAAARDSSMLVDICASIGLDIGERTAHRILAGQIEPAQQPLQQVLGTAMPSAAKPVDIYRDSRGLKISKDDLSRFSRELEKCFDQIAESYYLQLSDEPKIRVGKDCITVKFPIDKEL